MVVVNALHGDSAAAAVVDELFSDGAGVDLETFFDHAALEVAACGGGARGEEDELEWLLNKDAFPAVETMSETAARPRTKGARRPRRLVAKAAVAGRRCRHCGTEETPQWRKGPEGGATLCNACGLRYRNGRLVPELPAGGQPQLLLGTPLQLPPPHRRRPWPPPPQPPARSEGGWVD